MSKKKQHEWEAFEESLKVTKIIHEVLGWECFGSWEAYLRKYGAQEWKLGAGKTYTTPTPVAFYVDYAQEWRVFSPDHEQLDVFDPLHNLNDAWQVVRAINKPVDGSHERYARFIDALTKAVGSDMFFDLFYCDPESDNQHLTPARICDAALWAIEPEGHKKPVEITSNDQGTIEGTKTTVASRDH